MNSGERDGGSENETEEEQGEKESERSQRCVGREAIRLTSGE